MNAIKAFHTISLAFSDKALENKYSSAMLPHTRHQGRAAIYVGVLVYLFLGVLDQWLILPEHHEQVWIIRLTALCVPAVVLAASYTIWFSRLSNLLLASVGLAAGIGLIAIQMHMSSENAALFYPAMVLATFFTYNFIGTRFIYALATDLLMLLSYNLIFGIVMDYPVHILAIHDFFIISANLIGGAAGYLAERQKRLLFLRETELDAERKHHMERSLQDVLTGLPNRELLYDRISQAISKSEREQGLHCGYFLDLDGFKSVNDRLSHEMGDHILNQVGQRLKSTVRSMDTVARIGGDEFFVLATDIHNKTDAIALAEKLLDQFNMPFEGLPEDIKISASIGMCLFPYEGMTVSDIIRRADKAMYQIKSNGKNNFAFAEPLQLAPENA